MKELERDHIIANRMKELTTEQKSKEIAEFVRMAFCADSISDYKSCEIVTREGQISGGVFTLQDSKRGKFTIAISNRIIE